MRKRHADHPGLGEKPKTSFDIAGFYASQGIHPKWANCRLEDFESTPVRDKINNYVTHLKEHADSGMGLYVYGPPGVGKSHFVFSLYRHLYTETTFDAGISLFDSLLSLLFASWQSAEKRAILDRKMRQNKFLFVEGFGRELGKGERKVPDKLLETIIRTRAMGARPTIVTSTLPPADIAEEYSEELASLMKEYLFPLSFSDMADRRKTKKL